MLPALLFAAATAVQIPAGAALTDAITARDATLFHLFFQECAPARLAALVTPDFEMSTTNRSDLLYHKEDLLISGTGKHPDYNFWRVSGVAIANKGKGEGMREEAPTNYRSNMP